ncbi:MAG: hypothetical protein ISS77_05295 [Phycisphaerae bacterium]|nr:hypothetical protein [Phycisphaerae bacterium]
MDYSSLDGGSKWTVTQGDYVTWAPDFVGLYEVCINKIIYDEQTDDDNVKISVVYQGDASDYNVIIPLGHEYPKTQIFFYDNDYFKN